jgi:hypothetical protein
LKLQPRKLIVQTEKACQRTIFETVLTQYLPPARFGSTDRRDIAQQVMAQQQAQAAEKMAARRRSSLGGGSSVNLTEDIDEDDFDMGMIGSPLRNLSCHLGRALMPLAWLPPKPSFYWFRGRTRTGARTGT